MQTDHSFQFPQIQGQRISVRVLKENYLSPGSTWGETTSFMGIELSIYHTGVYYTSILEGKKGEKKETKENPKKYSRISLLPSSHR